MLAYNDPKWKEFKGGYKLPYDPTPVLQKLEDGTDTAGVWEELWQELHHQSDIGEASYAAIPHLVRIHEENHTLDWNLYALAATIEIERHRKTNPPLPPWLAQDYREAWKILLNLAIDDLRAAKDEITVQVLLGVIALGKGLLTLGAVISDFTEDERLEILDKYNSWSESYQRVEPLG
jgi:hypothetical protein